MTLNTINATNALQSAVFALEAILQNHPLTDDEFNQLEEAYQGAGSMLALADVPERGVSVITQRDDKTIFTQPYVPGKSKVTALALHRAFVALTLEFCTPLAATDGLVEYVNDAASMLVEWAVL